MAVAPADLAKQACDGRRDLQARTAALGALLTNPPGEERTQALRQVIAHGDEGVAPAAARSVMYAHEFDVSPEVVKRITAWSDRSCRVVLETLFNSPKVMRDFPGLLDIPRQVIRDVAESKRASLPYEGDEAVAGTAIDQAALIVATVGGSPDDQKLLRSALAREARSRGLWLARARFGNLTDAEIAVARRTYSDDVLPISVRGAAAVALAPRDRQADAFVRSSISDLLARHANTMEIRNMAATIAAVRWPDRFLAEAPASLTPEEQAQYTAIVAVLGGGAGPAVDAAKQVPAEASAAASQRLRENGNVIASPYFGFVSCEAGK